MSESQSPVVPEQWRENYSDLSITTTKNGHDRLYGIEIETENKVRLPWKILNNAVQEAYGFRPQSWTPENFAVNPELWKERLENGRLRTQLYGSQDAEKLNTEKINEIEQLNNWISELSEAMNQMESRLNTFEQHNAELEAQNSEKDRIIADLRSRLEGKEPEASPPDRKPEAVADELVTEERTEIIEEPAEAEERTRVRLEETRLHPHIDSEPDPDPEIEEVVTETEEDDVPARRSWRERALDWITWRRPFAAVVTRRLPDDTEVREEVIVERQRRSVNPIVAAALGAGAVGLAWLISSKTGHDHSEELRTIINNNSHLEHQNTALQHSVDVLNAKTTHLHDQLNHIGGVIGHLNSVETAEHSQSSLQAFDYGHIRPGLERNYLDGVNNGFAVDLPKGAHVLENADKTFRVVGQDGSTWVDKIEGDRQGHLAEAIRSALKAKGFKIQQDSLTYLDVSGPGKHGLVKHYVTAITPQ